MISEKPLKGKCGVNVAGSTAERHVVALCVKLEGQTVFRDISFKTIISMLGTSNMIIVSHESG